MTNIIRNTERGDTDETLRKSRGAEEGARGQGKQRVGGGRTEEGWRGGREG